MQGQQTTIYGHHMNDGSMFCRIDDASNQDVFDEIECAYYITRGTTYRLSPIMTSVVEETHVEVRQANFGSQEDLKTYLMDMLAKASAKAPDARERVAAADRVLSLVTCNWAIGGRFGSVRSVMILNVDEAYPTAASDAASDAAATDAA